MKGFWRKIKTLFTRPRSTSAPDGAGQNVQEIQFQETEPRHPTDGQIVGTIDEQPRD